MPDPLEIAIRAEEAAKLANYRLDRMNGSLDHVGKSVDIIDAKVDAILIKMATAGGAANAREEFVVSRRFAITTAAAMLGSSLLSTLFVLATNGHL